MSSDAATAASRRYVEASVMPTSVYDASMQYVTRNSASARRTPRGWKKATTSNHASIKAQVTTPKNPSIR